MAKTIADRPEERRKADLDILRAAGKVFMCARLLVEAGLPLEAFQRVINDPDMRERLAKFWRTGCKETTASQAVARGIMGSNMIGVGEMLDYFGIMFSAQHELSDLAAIPFPEEVLQACKDTHILFPGYPLSIMEIRRRHPKLFSSRDGRWYDDKPFAKNEQVQCCWYLLKRSGTNPTDVLNNEVVPRACEVVFGLVLARLREQSLFEQGRVACWAKSDKLVYVGLEEWGISIGDICSDPNPLFASIMKSS